MDSNEVRGPTNGKVEKAVPNGPSSKEATDLAFNQFAKRVEVMVGNEMTSRANFLNRIFDRRRDVDAECGWSTSVTPDQYQSMYDWGAIPARVVEVWPKESWQVLPEVYESEDPDELTPFEEGLAAVAKSLRGEHSWYEPEENNPLWHHLQDLDVKAGIGRYGALLLGVDDKDANGKPCDLRQPLVPPKVGEPTRKILFLRVLPESLARIATFEMDSSSCRFGKPTSYDVTMVGGEEIQPEDGTTSQATTTRRVHWSRIVHGSEGETFHAPRMKQVWPQLLDLRKLYGGSAEMYWKGAFPGFSLETHPQLGGDVKVDVEALRDRMEQFWNSLDRTMLNVGMHAQMMSPTVVDPTPQINVQIEAICIRLECPVPVFKGYEIGEQASTNNDSDWKNRVASRRRTVLTPKYVVPLLDRLIQVGILPRPEEGYRVWWPDGAKKTDAEKADVAAKNTATLVAYVGGGGSQLIPEMHFLTSPTFLDMDDEEAAEILEAMTKGPDDGGDLSQDTFISETDPFATDEYAVANLERVCNGGEGSGVKGHVTPLNAKVGQRVKVHDQNSQFRGKEGKVISRTPLSAKVDFGNGVVTKIPLNQLAEADGKQATANPKEESYPGESLEVSPRPFALDENVLAGRDGGIKEMQRALKEQYPKEIPLFHEVPIQHLESVKRSGLISGESVEDTNFFSVGKTSQFVNGKDKLIVEQRLPTTDANVRSIQPDQRYEPGVGADRGATDMLREHGGMFGAYIAREGATGPNSLHAIHVMREGRIAETLMRRGGAWVSVPVRNSSECFIVNGFCINCGGEGGTPGPCKVEGKEDKDPASRAIDSLKSLEAEMGDPADADAKLARIRQASAALRGMSKEAVFKVAEGMGVTYYSPKTKEAAVKRIENRIIEKLSTAVRHPFKQGGA